MPSFAHVARWSGLAEMRPLTTVSVWLTRYRIAYLTLTALV